MEAITVAIDEDLPSAWPTVSDLLDGIDPNPIWDGIEEHVAYRWGERSCTFTVEGPGEWRPELLPFSRSDVFRRDADQEA